VRIPCCIGEGWWWWWLKCGSVNFFCVNGMRDTAKHSSAKRKTDSRLHTTLFLTTVSLSRDGNFSFFPGFGFANRISVCFCRRDETPSSKRRSIKGPERKKPQRAEDGLVLVRPFLFAARTTAGTPKRSSLCVCASAPCCSGF